MNPKIPGRVRFYMPTPYEGPEIVSFTLLGGQTVHMRAESISCFEEFFLPNCFRKFVEVFQMRGFSRVILETREEVLAYLTPTFREGEG